MSLPSFPGLRLLFLVALGILIVCTDGRVLRSRHAAGVQEAAGGNRSSGAVGQEKTIQNVLLVTYDLSQPVHGHSEPGQFLDHHMMTTLRSRLSHEQSARITRVCSVRCRMSALKRLRGEFSQLLSSVSVTWWINYGSLIGAARWGTTSPFDEDTDIAILDLDRDGKRESLLRAIRDKDSIANHRGKSIFTLPRRLPVSRRTTAFLIAPSSHGCFARVVDLLTGSYIDVYGMETSPSGIRDTYRNVVVPTNYVRPLQKVLFHGVATPAPAKPVEYLHAVKEEDIGEHDVMNLHIWKRPVLQSVRFCPASQFLIERGESGDNTIASAMFTLDQGAWSFVPGQHASCQGNGQRLIRNQAELATLATDQSAKASIFSGGIRVHAKYLRV